MLKRTPLLGGPVGVDFELGTLPGQITRWNCCGVQRMHSEENFG